MAPRYHLREGIVVRRRELPSGDVVVTVLGSGGKWRGVARKGKLLGGNLARLSLFHEVSVQGYRKRDDDLLLITQVELSGALPALSQPALYPYAHLLAELAEHLAVAVASPLAVAVASPCQTRMAWACSATLCTRSNAAPRTAA